MCPSSSTLATESGGKVVDHRVSDIHSRKEFEQALRDAGDNLLVVEYTKLSLPNTAQIYPALVEISRSTPQVSFLRVLGDQSDELKSLCEEAGVTRIPSYIYYKQGEKIHETQGMDEGKLREDILHYGINDYPVEQLHSKEDFDSFIQAHADDGTLVVVNVSLKFCGPCVRVYPTVLQLSHKMKGDVVFGRIFGDENQSCESLVSSLKIVEAPTFLFYRNGELQGQYVGSNRGDVIGEVLRYQGVRVTY